MQSQEEIRFCEPADDLNHIFSYENDLKLQLHRPFYHQNGLAKQPSSQLNKGSPRTDNYNGHKNTTHQLNSDTVCVYFAVLFFSYTRPEIKFMRFNLWNFCAENGKIIQIKYC